MPRKSKALEEIVNISLAKKPVEEVALGDDVLLVRRSFKSNIFQDFGTSRSGQTRKFKFLKQEFYLKDLLNYDPHLQLIFNLRLAAIFSRNWEIQGGAARIRKFVQDMLRQMPQDFFGIIRTANEIKFKDRNCFTEIIWFWNDKTSRWEFRLFPLEKHFDYQFDTDTGIPTGVILNNSSVNLNGYNPTAQLPNRILPLEKFYITTYKQSFENIYGEYALLSCAMWSLGKIELYRKWLMRCDKFANPKIFIESIAKEIGDKNLVPAVTPSKAKKDAFMQALNQLENIDILEVLFGYKLTPMQMQQMGQSEYKDLMQYINNEMSKAWIGNPGLVEMIRGGSYAALDIQQQVSQPLIFQDIQTIEEEVNNQLINRLVYYNFKNAKIDDYPRFRIARDSPEISVEAKNIMINAYREFKQDSKIEIPLETKNEIGRMIFGFDLNLTEKKEEEKPIINPLEGVENAIQQNGGTARTSEESPDRSEEDLDVSL